MALQPLQRPIAASAMLALPESESRPIDEYDIFFLGKKLLLPQIREIHFKLLNNFFRKFSIGYSGMGRDSDTECINIAEAAMGRCSGCNATLQLDDIFRSY